MKFYLLVVKRWFPVNAFYVIILFFLSACQKDVGSSFENGLTKVKITMGQVRSSLPPEKYSSVSRTLKDINTPVIIPLDDNYSFIATLRPVTENNNSVRNKLASSNIAATPIRTDLDNGTIYVIAVYGNEGTYVLHEQFTYTAGKLPEISLKGGGDYTFVVVASGNNSLPTIDFTLPLNTLVESISDPDTDLMYFSQSLSVTENQSNELNVILKHLFTEVTVSINTADIGSVASIGNGTVSPNYSDVNVYLADGSLVYPINATVGSRSFTFPTTTGSTLTSAPVFILSNGAIDGSITLADVQIGDVTKSLTYPNIAFVDGIRYSLEFNLVRGGFDIGGEVWSPGNLVFDPGNEEFAFSSSNNDFGDYFFANHIYPKRLDGTNQGPDPTINGPDGDPCSLVAPAGTWRLPTETEISALIANTGPNGVDNPHNVNAWDPARFVDTYDGSTGTHLGMFFGTQNNPGADRNSFLYFVFAGSYHNENTGGSEIGTQGHYLLTGTNMEEVFHMTGTAGTVGYGLGIEPSEINSAYQIRCVKND